MDGFKRDYEKLFQRFLAQSRVTGPESDLTDKSSLAAGQAASSVSGSSQLVDTCKVYNFTFFQFHESFRKLKFAAIFCGHRNVNSLREFFEQVTKFVIDQLSPKQTIERRIFSFYLLYSLWFLQLKSYKLSFKIRVDKLSYTNLQDLVQYSLKQQQFDIVLAYRKLLLAGAFIFCESTEQYGPYFKNYLARCLPQSNCQVVLSFKSSIYKSFECPFSFLAFFQETNAHIAEIKADKQDYCEALKMLNENGETQSNCDNLLYYMEQFEDNCF